MKDINLVGYIKEFISKMKRTRFICLHTEGNWNLLIGRTLLFTSKGHGWRIHCGPSESGMQVLLF